MWLRAGRNSFFSRAFAASLAVLVCGSALEWGHLGGDDRDCDVVVVRHDHAAHRWSIVPVTSASPSSDHCYICHSLRLWRQALTSRVEGVAVAQRTARPIEGVVVDIRDGLRVGLASRAPPAVHL